MMMVMMMRRQRYSHTFLVLLLMVFIAGIVLSGPSTPRRSRVRRQNMKVRINATGDTIVMKFLRPNADTKLEGYILGYGSSMFSKQFIQLPENGQPYETEFDAEPKYLIAVQPIPTNDVKKHCTGKVELEKPLHLVIGSVTPTSVLLSWGTLLKTPYEGNIMNDCLEDGHYTVRYRERNRKWNYQTCPTSDTVIDHLKPNTVYEFGVQPNSKDGTGIWSKPVIHNISTPGVEEKAIRKIFKRPIGPVKPLTTGPHSFPFSPHHVLHNRTRGRQPLSRNIAPQTTLAPTTTTRQASLSTPGPTLPVVNKQPIGGGDLYRSVLPPFLEAPLAPKLHSSVPITATMASVPVPNANVDKQGGHPRQKPVSQPHAQPPPKSRLQPYYRPPLQPKSQPQQPQVMPQVKAQPVPKPHGQTKPQPIATPQPKLQTQPQPKATPQPIPQTQPQPQTVQPKLQTQPQLQATSHPIMQTHSRLQSQPKSHPQSNHQTTPQFQSAPQPQPTLKTKHQAQPQTQPQLKPQPQPRVQLAAQPTPVAQPRINQPTRQHKPHAQEILPKTYTQPQTQSPIQRQTQSPIQRQTQTQPQPKTPQPLLQLSTKQHSRAKQTPRPNIIFARPKPTTQPQSKNQPMPQLPPHQKKQQKPQSQPQPRGHPKPPTETTNRRSRIRNQQHPEPKIHPRHRSQHPGRTQARLVPHSQPISKPQPPPKAQSQSQPLPKLHTASKPQPLPHPGLHFQPQTRTYSDPTKVAPRQAVPTAPSPPEEGKPLPRPALATEKAGTGILRPSIAEVPRSPISSSVPTAGRNTTLSRTRVPPHSTNHGVRPFSPSKTVTSPHSSSTPGASGAHHRGNALPKPVVWSKEKPVLRPPVPGNKRPNLVGKPSDLDKPMDLKQGDKESILKPFPLVTAKPKQERRQQTTTSAPAVNSSRFDINENSSIFRPLPASEVDIMGKKRFVAPHVIYKTDKKPDEPCSITSSLAYFPDEEGGDQNVTGPPRIPPSNVTVVTVEGCPSFVILDWQKSDNETREYEVVSTTKGPNGQEVSILTTNQTHTAVENLKPESSYEFKVTPKNELGTGPSSDPVSFSTESADPRVSEYVSGKDAIWTQFPFKSDAYSECSGKQYVKRTWYRKFVGIQLCNSLRYKIYLSDSLNGKFYNIGDQTGHGEDHCQFVDSFLDGRTGTQMFADQLPSRPGFYRALRQEPVSFGEIGGKSHVTYVGWYECGTPIPGKW
ncbi:target of Nesh-SH3-like isoform X2 [Stegastes partitus]|uniref:Target of Nesh-SH3-like isoform X2 n=1 Tax=Stegastes partitus TaxID=144197 RepID=A0A9Y4TXR4_9TELE|nr:PREDICTED: target of Nesh-SH3-like isoform X2 [Stegastes partitus]